MTSASPPSDEPTAGPRLEHTIDDETPASTAIIRAIAILENVRPEKLSDEVDLTLYDHVDPDALDRLVAADAERGVSIALGIRSEHEYAVRIRSTGHLIVRKYE